MQIRDAVKGMTWAVSLKATPPQALQTRAGCTITDRLFFISPITVQVETPEHKLLAQPWLPANVAAVELSHICKAQITDASFLAFCLHHKLSKLEQGLHQSFGSKHCRQLKISQTTCSPCLHQPMSHIHLVQCQHFIHSSYFLEPLRAVVSWELKSLLLDFPRPDEISHYQQRENIYWIKIPSLISNMQVRHVIPAVLRGWGVGRIKVGLIACKRHECLLQCLVREM